MTSATVAIEGRNLLVFGSSYKNYLDPETMSNAYATPAPKSVTLSLNLFFNFIESNNNEKNIYHVIDEQCSIADCLRYVGYPAYGKSVPQTLAEYRALLPQHIKTFPMPEDSPASV